MLFSSIADGTIDPGAIPYGVEPRSARKRVFLDEAGHQARLRQMVWIMSVPRVFVLAEILLLIYLSTDWIGSTSGAWLVLAAGLVYTLSYMYAALWTRAAGTKLLHALDIATGAGLLILAARTSAVLFSIAFYTSWISWGRMTWRFRDVFPATAILSVSYLIAERISIFPHDSSSDVQAVFSFYWMRGLYAVGFAYVLYRVSALELDTHLENQRLRLRRTLHDDLGNTLCGLHYRIEGLQLNQPEKIGPALRFLESGYARARSTLTRILKGLDEPAVDIAEALVGIKKELEELGWNVNIDMSKMKLDVSPEVSAEIISILREAAANAVKHSGGSNLNIEVGMRKHRIVFTISDDGDGFESETLVQRHREGAKGIKGMTERAELVKGQLKIDSRKGHGTRIMLEAHESKGRSMTGRILNIGEGNQGGFYNTLVRAKQLGMGIQLVRTALLPMAVIADPFMIAITVAVVADTLVWTFFRDEVFRALRRNPWLLVIECALFCLLFYATWTRDLPFMIVDTTNLFMVMAAYFLSGRRAIYLSFMLAAGIIIASLLAPALPGTEGMRNELIILNITSNIFFAISVGFFVKFINALEEMQKDAVSRTLARQRVQFSAATHRQIHSAIRELEHEVAGMKDVISHPGAVLTQQSKDSLKQHSNDTKRRLRKILNYLDEPTAA